MADALIHVRVLQLGRKVFEYQGSAGETLRTVLDALAINVAQGMDLRVNTAPADLDQVVHDKDIVTILPRIKGGRS
jgi:hypothetical protein